MSQPLVAHRTPFNLQRVSCPLTFIGFKKTEQSLKLSCIPPPLRWKSNWFHVVMDAMIDNDTCDTHWELSLDDSNKMLNFLFPDQVLFPASKGELAKDLGHYAIGDILQICKQHGLYDVPGNNEVGTSSDNEVGTSSDNEVGTSSDNEVGTSSDDKAGTSGDDTLRQPFWLDAPRLDANAPADHEITLALFFNNVLTCTKQACSTVECL